MRTLKKTLCLVLALVMVLSLGATAFAADYNDQAEIEHKEAAAVMKAIKVFEGDDKGDFRPTDSINRAEAAKVICVMLGANTAAYAGAPSQFTDVTSDWDWAKEYINCCAAKGIVSGYGNGRFGPGDPVTGTQFGKMLMGALGYNFDIEKYKGEPINGNSGWEIAVASLMQNNAQILSDLLSVNLSQPLTRDNACQMAFNTLTADMVYYDNDKRDTVNGSDDVNYDDTTDGDGVMQFCESKFPELKKGSGATDAMGRIINGWTLNDEAVDSEATATPAYTVSGQKKAGDVVKELKALGITKVAPYTAASGNDPFVPGVQVYINGIRDVKLADPETNGYIDPESNLSQNAGLGNSENVLAIKGISGEYSTTGSFNGDTVWDRFTGVNNNTIEVYTNAKNEITRVIIYTTYTDVLSKNDVVAAKGEDAAYIKLGDLLAGGNAGSMKYETEDFAAGDVVLYTYTWNADDGFYIVTAEKAESFTGKLERFGTNSTTGVTTYTIDGTGYVKSDAAVYDWTNPGAADIGEEYTWYVDGNNNLVYVDKGGEKEEESKPTNYIYVLNHGNAGTGVVDPVTGVTTYTISIYGVKSDGTYGTFTALFKTNPSSWTNSGGKAPTQYGLYTYKTSGDNLELTPVAVGDDSSHSNGDGCSKDAQATAAINVGDAKVTYTGSGASPVTAAMDSNTKFIFMEYKDSTHASADGYTLKTVTPVTSSKNIGATITATNAFVAVNSDTNVAEVVYVFGAYTPGTSAEATDTLVLVDGYTRMETTIDSKDNKEYTYTVYTDEGEKIENVKYTGQSAPAANAYAVWTLDEDGNLSAAYTTGTVKNGVISSEGSGSLVVNGDTYFNITEKTGVIYLDKEAVTGTTLKVGQEVYVAPKSGADGDAVAVWVVKDPVTKKLSVTAAGAAATGSGTTVDLTGKVATDPNPTEINIIAGAGVVNKATITLKITGAISGEHKLVVSENPDVSQVAIVGNGEFTVKDVTADGTTLKVDVTVTGATNDVTLVLKVVDATD